MHRTLLSSVETPASATPEGPSPRPKSDPYRGVVFVLLVASLAGTAGALAGELTLANPILLDTAITFGLATGILIGVALAQAAREGPAKNDEAGLAPLPPEEAARPLENDAPTEGPKSRISTRLTAASQLLWKRFMDLEPIQVVKFATAAAGILAIVVAIPQDLSAATPSLQVAGITALICLAAAGLAATAAHYLADVEPIRFPEALGLSRGARVIAWLLMTAAASMFLAWAGQTTILRVLHFAVLMVNAAVCYGLLKARRLEGEVLVEAFPVDFGALSLLGSRPNILGSVLDTGERQLGIDLRSTWALTVVRRWVEPLLVGLCVLGWLSTSLTVVGLEEQGLVEHLGVPAQGQPFQPGLHFHWPWPIDRVFRIPMKRVLALQVGHEGEEAEGPEDVLWAVEHAPNEYTLVLGNGRDLITVDAAVQYRIVDARAWRYHSQNPADALKAIAYRAVMRNTVDKTLTDALSENVATLTNTMRAMVQRDSDALGLGVEVDGFTVGGMHPPVPVAADYEAVVSAELGKVTAVANANAFRNSTVPAAEAMALMDENTARAEGADELARAAGEAWAFRELESQYHSAPQDYLFRRRLETLENGLAGRHFTIVDSRFQRDGGEIWLTQ